MRMDVDHDTCIRYLPSHGLSFHTCPTRATVHGARSTESLATDFSLALSVSIQVPTKVPAVPLVSVTSLALARHCRDGHGLCSVQIYLGGLYLLGIIYTSCYTSAAVIEQNGGLTCHNHKHLAAELQGGKGWVAK